MKKIIRTPHIVAHEGAFSPYTLIAGDPNRIKHIAQDILKDAVEIASVRGMTAYTGKYKGVKISLMPHGMGQPSMAIYATELMKDFGVTTLVRVGTCGAIDKSLTLGDIVVAKNALTESNILDNHKATNTDCSPALLKLAQVKANIKETTFFTSDLFYSPKNYYPQIRNQCGVVEMETAILYALANKYKCNALSLCTVTDFVNGKKGEMTAEERALGVDKMIYMALDILVAYHKQQKTKKPTTKK